MATYVMGEIHGCYRDFLRMMNKIGFSEADRMLLVGDYIDRGPNSFDMLRWLEKRPKNVYPVKGNHDVDFGEYVRIMRKVDAMEGLRTDENSNEETIELYDTVNELIGEAANPDSDMSTADISEINEITANVEAFDKFGTISDFLTNRGVTLKMLNDWAFMLGSYPLQYRFNFMDKDVVVVHAGYPASADDVPVKFKNIEDFCLHAREESIRFGGIPNGIIVAGHTPTIAKKMFCFTGGRIYKHTDEEKNCVFYNVDCGCAYKEVSPFGKMCCLRLDDEAIFYD